MMINDKILNSIGIRFGIHLLMAMEYVLDTTSIIFFFEIAHE